MTHVTKITRRQPAQAASLLEWQQKGVVLGAFATGFSTLATAFNTYTQADERKNPEE